MCSSSQTTEKGVYGLDLGYSDEQGPCLIQRVEVQGFDIGIHTKFGVNSVTMEHITLNNQNIAGLSNDGQCISIRGFTSNNNVRAVINKGTGTMVLIDGQITGLDGASNLPAIDNSYSLFARNVTTVGYGMAVLNKSGHQGNHEGNVIQEFVSHRVMSLFDSPLKILGIRN